MTFYKVILPPLGPPHTQRPLRCRIHHDYHEVQRFTLLGNGRPPRRAMIGYSLESVYLACWKLSVVFFFHLKNNCQILIISIIQKMLLLFYIFSSQKYSLCKNILIYGIPNNICIFLKLNTSKQGKKEL